MGCNCSEWFPSLFAYHFIAHPEHTHAQVDDMLRGNPAPWHVGSQQSGMELMLGRKHFMATNDLKRCNEQIDIMAIEKVRLLRYLDRTISNANIAVAADGEHLQLPDHKLTVESGKLFRLKQHIMHLKAQKADASKLFV